MPDDEKPSPTLPPARRPSKKWTSAPDLGSIFRDQVPPWVWLVVVLLGSGVSGGIGSQFGAGSDDFRRLEQKVDKLEHLLTEIRIEIATHHGSTTP